VAGDPVSPQSDIYSLGIVLYESLAGVRPFDGPSPAAVALERLRVPARPLRELRPELSSSLEAIVMRALERDPQARQPSAAELAGELERFRIAELGGIRRRGIGARAVRTRGTPPALVGSGAADPLPVAATAWADDATRVESAVGDSDLVHEGQYVPTAVAAAATAAPSRGRARRRRRRAFAPVAAAAALGLAALSFIVLVASANLLGHGLAGGVLGQTSSPRSSDMAVAGPTASPTPSPSPTPTSSPTPSPTPAPTASTPPTPTAASTSRPTQRPTPRPTQPPAAGPTAPARDPAETVRRFYDLVERHEFDAAARLWTRRMREQYPPERYIDGRFAPTTRIDIDRLSIERMSLRNRTAVVSVAITEYRSSGPSPRRFAGTWELVLTDAGWLMDEPHF
jgi:serine/threonine-protein kinase